MDRVTGEAELVGQRRRIAWLTALFAAMAFALFVRLVQWQLLPQPQLREQGSALLDLTNKIQATRGNILDANGHYLAASTVSYKISASPRLLGDDEREELAPRLAEILGQPVEELLEKLEDTSTEYKVLATSVPFWQAMDVQDLQKSALRLEVEFARVYPDGELAASVLGFQAFLYNNEPQYGVEQYYDDVLAGVNGHWRGVADLWGQQILVSESGYTAAQDGADLVLTIDRNVQARAEELLRDTITEHKAIGGTIIVLEVRTGAVIAMANHPSFTPGRYWEVEDASAYRNSAISSVYEPGSVFKPLTLAAALEARVIRPDDVYDDRGEIIVGGKRIYNADLRAHGQQTMTELLAYSRNVGAAHVVSLLGPTRYYETIRKFGFSEVTGVDLFGEAAGVMRVPGNRYWTIADLGANSYGQGISATPLQVAAAYGALANGGALMRPYVVAERRYADRVETTRPFRVRQVVSPEVAEQITTMLADAVELGMRQASVPGYRVAGKSGTAGIGEEAYRGTETIVSFVGYAPIPDPQFVVLVKLDKPTRGRWGTEVAAPAFSEMAQFLFDHYGILPQQEPLQRAGAGAGSRTP